MAQEQTSAAHVPAPDESGGEDELLSEDRGKDGRVLGSRDAPEEDDLRVREAFADQRRVSAERLRVEGIRGVDVVRGVGAQEVEAHGMFRPPQTFDRRDDEDPRQAGGRAREGSRVRELPAEVEPAHEREHLAERRLAPAERLGERQRGARREKKRGTSPAAGRRRQQEHAGRTVVHARRKDAASHEPGRNFASVRWRASCSVSRMQAAPRIRFAIGAAVVAAAVASGCSTARVNARAVRTARPERAEVLESALASDARLPRGASVAVDPQTGVVRLSGNVANAEERANAGRVACSVQGVTVVYNELEIRRAGR